MEKRNRVNHYHHCFTLTGEHERALEILLKRFNIKEPTHSAELRSLIMKLYFYVNERDNLGF